MRRALFWLERIDQDYKMKAYLVDFYAATRAQRALVSWLRHFGVELRIVTTETIGTSQTGSSCGLVAAQVQQVLINHGSDFQTTPVGLLQECVSVPNLQEANHLWPPDLGI